MHKADIERLEDFLINQEKYKKLLRFREMELQDKAGETVPEYLQDNDIQDPTTIKAGGVVSTVELGVIKKHSDLQYQSLYSIVCNTPKFINSMNDYERAIYEYRYREIDLSVYEWEDIAMKLTDLGCDSDKSFSKSTTLRLRNKMLERLADYIEIVLM